MAKRKHSADPDLDAPDPPAVCTDPVPGSRLEATLQALSDILRCNTARKCHDRARLALSELDP